MEIQNKTAIVTGVSKGIGKELTLQLLDKGAKVFGLGVTTPNYTHTNFHFIKANIRKQQEVNQAFAEIIKLHQGDIDIMINNAGLGYFGNFEDMAEEQFHELFEVNVFGIYYLCRQVIPKMKAQTNGHIINISSIAGLEGMPQVAAYCGAKHAVKGITDSLFRELREFGIKVTGVYPGSVQTDFFRNSPGIKAHDKMLQPWDVAKQIINAIETPDNFNTNSIEFRPLKIK
ncbi:MAG: SDR family NAD(P)-dependent oxidoreductase [Bacteroidetes bacterium]|nr:SDR family NAD(P)-dependent oxidoreductase [Bacteroidota bacterium]